jgi:hypothetical protein
VKTLITKPRDGSKNLRALEGETYSSPRHLLSEMILADEGKGAKLKPAFARMAAKSLATNMRW